MCNQEATQRARAICHSLEQEMQWEWLGHAIVSPGYRVGFESVRKTYCRLPILAEDTATLVALATSHWGVGMRDVQIENGARWLLYLLGPSALENFPSPEGISKRIELQAAENLRRDIALTIADPGTIWNRSNPQYLLRDGCK